MRGQEEAVGGPGVGVLEDEVLGEPVERICELLTVGQDRRLS